MTGTKRGSIAYKLRAGAASITLDDADTRNAINSSSVDQLCEAVLRARADHASVVVLRSNGRFFSVGGDLAAFGAADDMGAYIDELAGKLHRVVSELTHLDAIVVTVVQGMAAGAGFPLTAAGDIVVAAKSARFTLGYTKVGLSVDGGTSLLVATLGLHRALRLALLNDVLSADEAQAAGLVARVYDGAELGESVEKLVASLLAGSSSAFAATKHLLRDSAVPAPETALRNEALAIRSCAETGDGREGVQAFPEKRSPEFRASTNRH